ncbi:hypothetical protein ACIQXD_13855 [Streptomyces uncialis]|uniref:hypothetical protein n=1 Tax=Streptomyces uncialis TaxID=1048205 RepID=UPI0037F7D8D8
MTQGTTTPVAGAAGAAADVWAEPADRTRYEQAVRDGLAETRIARRLNTRPAVTAENVEAAMLDEAHTAQVRRLCEETYTEYRAARDLHVRNARALRDEPVEWDVRSVVGLVCLVLWAAHVVVLATLVRDLSILRQLAAVAFSMLVAVVVLTPPMLWVFRRPRSAANLERQLTALWQLTRRPWLAFRSTRLRRQWLDDLRQNAVRPVLPQVIDALLGDDPYSVLMPDNYKGLRAAQDRDYVVPGNAAAVLERKLSMLDGGTVALSGPRGVGKTTLLENAPGPDDFAVATHVPAAYTPHDFLLFVFARVCERYIEREGYPVPEFTRLSGLVRATRRLRSWLRRATRSLFFALPAAALVVLGSYAAARSLWRRHRDTAGSWTHTATEWAGDLAVEVWRGQNLGMGLLVTAVGVVLWRSRRSAGWRGFLRMVPRYVLVGVAAVLLFGVPVSLFYDADLGRHAEALWGRDRYVLTLTVLLFMALAIWAVGWTLDDLKVLGRRLPPHYLTTPLALAVGALFAWRLVRDGNGSALLTDDDNPARLLGLVLGALLLRLGALRVRPAEPPLVTECRDQLYRLRTVQTTSAAIAPGATQVASLLATHTSSLSTVPPNFPELVSDFRELLAGIAAQVHRAGHRTVISIDELDRLGTDAQALAFLGEVKAILGVPHVYFLLSVAEDVGAAFVRRGLPYRDATDSSLDDIVHVQPCTLAESRAIMDRRAPGLTPPDSAEVSPYVLLAHALSGGVARDLIRYGRRIIEVRQRGGSVELSDISRRLILEELSDTLAGFRTLLGKHPWTAQSAAVLGRYRALTGQLRHRCGCRADAVTAALQAFASHPGMPYDPDEPAAESTQGLLHEASTYAYYGLTLLQVFSPEDFEDRRGRAFARSATYGDPHFLAEIRLELALSSYSVRPLVDLARHAWALPVMEDWPPAAAIPAPRGEPCELHPQD